MENETVAEAWERGRRVGLRQYEITEKSSQYYQTRKDIIELLCITMWMRTWEECKDNERRVEVVHGFMRHLDIYVDKRIEDSYKRKDE
jgi:hypothetical protein